VVVTELVDSGLLGERIVPVLRHARNALLHEGGIVIPWGGEWRGLGVLLPTDC
jgi:predicted RNA methylase